MTAASTGVAGRRSDRALAGAEKRTLAVLALPTFGLALAITTVSTYLPLVARQFTGSTTIIGVIIGGEGLMALVLPLLVGAWSDRLRTRAGSRLPFVLVGVPAAAASLALMGLAGSLWMVAALIAIFFAAYFVAYEPYRALYPDLLPDEVAGRAQGAQAVSRGTGTALALVGGGLLFALDRLLPFAAAALLLIGACGAFSVFLLRNPSRSDRGRPSERGVAAALRHFARMLREHPALRSFMVANALWELSLGALKTFVVLYITAGLGYGVDTAGLIVGGTAVFVLVAAAVGGKLGDRIGRARLMQIAVCVYGAGLLVPFLAGSTAWVIVPFLPLVAFGGGIVMSLPYALLMPMMPEAEHGALTGLYSMSRGVGIMLGPLLAGVAVQAFSGIAPSTHGYSAMWLVCAAAVAASFPMIGRLRRDRDDRRQLGER